MAPPEDDRNLRRLGARLAGLQDRLRQHEGSDRFEVGCRRFLEATDCERPTLVRRAAVPVAVGASLAAAAALMLVWFSDTAPAGVTFTVGADRAPGKAEQWITASAERGLPVGFSDGTRIHLEKGARARVSALGADGARLVLESGGTRVRVIHRPNTRWQVDAGPFEVRVTGTAFRVSWSPEAQIFELAMREGRVLVNGPVLNENRTLRQGQALRVSVPHAAAVVSAADALPDSGEWVASLDARGSDVLETSQADDAPPPVQAVEEPEPADTPERAPAPASAADDWKSLAERGRYAEALRMAEARGYASLCRRLDPASLLRLAEVARFAGTPARAEQALTSLRGRFPGKRESAIAAYTLGRNAFDQKRAFGEAARWFETYLEEQPRGPLSREAQGRLIEALQRAGRTAPARSAARRYLERYPRGPHADIATRLLSE
jgi:ferric-dicitrate binding protein FerR (iron transport regulator)/TolA-binding protein